MKSRNLVAELAGAFAPEAGHPTFGSIVGIGRLGGDRKCEIISKPSIPSLLPDPVYGAAWRPQVVSVGFLDWRLSTAQVGSPC